jgi:hypothetical protein
MHTSENIYFGQAVGAVFCAHWASSDVLRASGLFMIHPKIPLAYLLGNTKLFSASWPRDITLMGLCGILTSIEKQPLFLEMSSMSTVCQAKVCNVPLSHV